MTDLITTTDTQTHLLVNRNPHTACGEGRPGDAITNESTEVDCLACLNLIAQLREALLWFRTGWRVGDPVPAERPERYLRMRGVGDSDGRA